MVSQSLIDKKYVITQNLSHIPYLPYEKTAIFADKNCVNTQKMYLYEI